MDYKHDADDPYVAAGLDNETVAMFLKPLIKQIMGKNLSKSQGMEKLEHMMQESEVVRRIASFCIIMDMFEIAKSHLSKEDLIEIARDCAPPEVREALAKVEALIKNLHEVAGDHIQVKASTRVEFEDDGS